MNANATVVVFDLDGTLCNIDHRKHLVTGSKPHDWELFNSLCYDDVPIQPIRELFYAMRSAGYTCVLLTGCSENWRELRTKWLNAYGIDYTNLYMRPVNDYRSDFVVKMELAAKHIGFENIVFAVEDRDRVVQAWRDNGVTCLQPCKGDY